MANDTYNRIEVLARLDAEKWHTGIDPHRGLMQIISEFIPTRLKQLTGCGRAEHMNAQGWHRVEGLGVPLLLLFLPVAL